MPTTTVCHTPAPATSGPRTDGAAAYQRPATPTAATPSDSNGCNGSAIVVLVRPAVQRRCDASATSSAGECYRAAVLSVGRGVRTPALVPVRHLTGWCGGQPASFARSRTCGAQFAHRATSTLGLLTAVRRRSKQDHWYPYRLSNVGGREVERHVQTRGRRGHLPVVQRRYECAL